MNLSGIIFAFSQSDSQSVFEIENFTSFFSFIQHKRAVIGSLWNELRSKNAVILELNYNENFNRGYLEPNLIQTFKFATPELQSFYRILIELCVVYFSLISCGVFVNRYNVIFFISVLIVTIFAFLIIIELIWYLLRFLYYKIRK